MGPLVIATVWLAACVDAAEGIAEKRPNAVRDGVKLVWDPPSWSTIPDLSNTYRRGRQLIYEAIAALQRRGEAVSAAAAVEYIREDLVHVIRRALALSRL